MAAELHVNQLDDEPSVLVVTGELDTHTAPRLDERLDLVAAGTHLVLDLAATSFVSSAGLSTILKAQRRLTTSGGSLVVRSPSPAVTRLIELSGLRDLLGLSDDRSTPESS